MNVNRISDRVESAACQSKEYVEEHAISTALVAFGLGVGVGFAMLSLLSSDAPPSRCSTTQRLGQQLLDAMSSLVPESLAKYGR